jgi:hypothetical protein
MHVQMKDMGIFNAETLSTKGMRAWAPGANICAGKRHLKQYEAENNETNKCNIHRNLLQE